MSGREGKDREDWLLPRHERDLIWLEASADTTNVQPREGEAKQESDVPTSTGTG